MTSERRAEAKNMDLDGENDSTDPLVEDLEVAMDELELLQDKLEEYQQHFLFADYSAHMRSLDKNWVWGEKDAETEVTLFEVWLSKNMTRLEAEQKEKDDAACETEKKNRMMPHVNRVPRQSLIRVERVQAPLWAVLRLNQLNCLKKLVLMPRQIYTRLQSNQNQGKLLRSWREQVQQAVLQKLNWMMQLRRHK